MTTITIFTPTYNRRTLIERLYQSLLQQSNKDFEWLVVDDGSTDSTKVFFSKILEQSPPFFIRYVEQPNGGKHRAINKGVSLANGELFFIVDSDDYLIPKAIEKVLQWHRLLDASHKWAGVSGLRGFSAQECIGQRNNTAQFIDAKNNERRKTKLEGDKAEIYFTEILRKYPFPEIPGENFISEEIVWNAIARDGYYLRWFNEIIYICNYIEGGLTRDKTKDSCNPQGCLLWAKSQLQTFPNDWRKRFLAIGIYRNAVAGYKSTSTVATELSVATSTVRLASLLLNIALPLFDFIQKRNS